MCGIAGIVSLGGREVLPEEVRAMCAAMVHRGPDEDGFHFDRGVGLGMRRLRVIDLETGSQPVRNEDGSVQAVLNGEIYNFEEIRAGLETRGHRFTTATDTEVIVHLYEEHGTGCVERLRGMFAFALWDARLRRLLLARDRLGIKPLYYAESGGRLLFASDLKAVLRIPDVGRELSWEAMGHLFAALCTPRSLSIVDGVRKLEPAHFLTVSPGQAPRIERYWDVAFVPDRGRREEDLAEELRERLEESVRLHLVSDVPLGAFLSGGIDSSSVVASMARMTSSPVKTFSIGFEEDGFDELAHARLVAERFGTEHHELVLGPGALESLEDLAWYLDEPFGDASAIPTWMVSKLASGYVTVALSGDGGDELFAGYDKYVVEGRERRHDRLPGAARAALGALGRIVPEGARGHNFLNHFSLAGPRRYLDASTLFTPAKQRRLFRPEAFRLLSRHRPWEEAEASLAKADGHWLSALQYLDLNGYLPLDILTKVDRMSMAHSLEARVPLLDHRLVEFAATIPPEMNLTGGTTKYLFKKAMRGILPDAILDRPKHGFAVPVGTWFRGRLRGFVRDLLLGDTARRRALFDASYVERLLKRHDQGRDLALEIWTLVSFELWCRVVLDRGPVWAAPTVPETRPLATAMRPRRATL